MTCKLCLKQPGKCPTHSLTPKQLSARNKKVCASHKANDPLGYIEQRKHAGRMGYKALVEAGKEHIARQKAKEWRLDNPSSLERIVMRWFNEEGIWYNREVEIGRYYVDFLVENICIEVNGEWIHSFRDDTHKIRYLKEQGYIVLVLPEKDLEKQKNRVINFIREK